MPDEKPKHRNEVASRKGVEKDNTGPRKVNYVGAHLTNDQMQILTDDTLEFQDSLSAAVRRAVVAYGKLKSRHAVTPAEGGY